MSARRAVTGRRRPAQVDQRDGPAAGSGELDGYRRARWLIEAELTRAAAWGLAFAGLLVYAQLFRHTYVDDAYISLQYARNLADHLSWGFLPGRTANTATSPLNVVLLAVGDRLLPGPTVAAVAWITAAEWSLLLAVLLRLSRRLLGGPHFGLLAFAGLVTNPLLLSTIGLEGYLFTLLMLCSLLAYLEGRWRLLGVALALLTLSRPDGVLLGALLIALAPGGRRVRARTGLAFAVTALPWYLYSWIHLGSALPDTLIIKLNQSAWGAATMINGVGLYRDRFGAATAASLWPAVLTPFALLALPRIDCAGRRAVGALVASAVAHFAVYAALGVPPFHWYYIQEVVTIVVLAALGAATMLRGLVTSPARTERWAALAATALPAVGLVALVWVGGWPSREAPISTNWGTPDQYRALGQDLHGLVGPDTVVDVRGEIGTVAYYCACRVVDDFADPNRIAHMIDNARADAPGPVAVLLAINFAWRQPEDPLPPPTRVLEFDPIDRGEVPQAPGPDAIRAWTVSSTWVPQTQVTLRARSLLSFEVRLRTADRTEIPASQQPSLSGEYQIFTVDGGPDHGEVARGTWSNNRADSIPVPPYTNLVIRVSHPAYGVRDTVIIVLGIGTVDVVVELTVPTPPPP